MTVSGSSAEMNEIGQLIEFLAADDAALRERARSELVRLGGSDVTRALVSELVDTRRRVRWEAAKALAALADTVAAPALLQVLDDDDADVRWVAGEGLIALREVGLLSVLSGMTRRAGSIEFCKSAHHVLHELKKWGHADVITPVLAALEQSEPQLAAPSAAYKAARNLERVGCRRDQVAWSIVPGRRHTTSSNGQERRSVDSSRTDTHRGTRSDSTRKPLRSVGSPAGAGTVRSTAAGGRSPAS